MVLDVPLYYLLATRYRYDTKFWDSILKSRYRKFAGGHEVYMLHPVEWERRLREECRFTEDAYDLDDYTYGECKDSLKDVHEEYDIAGFVKEYIRKYENKLHQNRELIKAKGLFKHNTRREEALLEVILERHIYKCEGRNDIPACSDCNTCKRPERSDAHGCVYHSFFYKNYFSVADDDTKWYREITMSVKTMDWVKNKRERSGGGEGRSGKARTVGVEDETEERRRSYESGSNRARRN